MGRIFTSVEQLIGGTPLLELARVAQAEGLDDTRRGSGGFGSTGTK